MATVHDLGLLMLRVGVGASCFSHGAQKLFGWFGGGGVAQTAEAMSSMGFEPGERSAWAAGVLETAGGAMLALGLATGPVGAALTGDMIVASSVHAPNGFFNTNGGFELPITYALVGSTFAMTGPGRFSIDHLTGEALNRPWMRVVALVGALAAAAFLVSTRSATVSERDDTEEE